MSRRIIAFLNFLILATFCFLLLKYGHPLMSVVVFFLGGIIVLSA